MTLSPRQARELLDRHGLAPRRAFGQNFVVDPNTVRRIARLADVGPGDNVVEIGPGLGALTRALIETGASVAAIEVDRGLAAMLRDEVVPLGVELFEADALRFDWSQLASRAPLVLVANLPYNIATPLVVELLAGVESIERMIVMVQREVAERFCAEPGTDAFGAVSLKIASLARARIVGAVPRAVFLPQPKVDSSLVSIERLHPAPLPISAERDGVLALVAAGFGQRRKMLRRSLGDRVTPEMFFAAGVRPEARAEELTLDDWKRLHQGTL